MKQHPINRLEEILGITVIHIRSQKNGVFTAACKQVCSMKELVNDYSAVTCIECLQIVLRVTEAEIFGIAAVATDRFRYLNQVRTKLLRKLE